MFSDYYAVFLLKSSSYILFTVAVFQLLYAVYLDLTTAKFPNKCFLIYLGLNLLLVLMVRGPAGLGVSFITMTVAVLILAPIYKVRMLGGGDVKLIFALSSFLLLNEFLGFLCMSFIWAGIFGLFKNLLGGSLRALLSNTLLVGRRVTVAQDSIPFTVGILLGWLSYKSFLSMGWLGGL